MEGQRLRPSVRSQSSGHPPANLSERATERESEQEGPCKLWSLPHFLSLLGSTPYMCTAVFGDRNGDNVSSPERPLKPTLQTLFRDTWGRKVLERLSVLQQFLTPFSLPCHEPLNRFGPHP